MKCVNCGIELADNAKFCPECGEKVVRECVCQNCGTKLAPNVKFCPECGTKAGAVIIKKPKCEVLEGSKFIFHGSVTLDYIRQKTLGCVADIDLSDVKGIERIPSKSLPLCTSIIFPEGLKAIGDDAFYQIANSLDYVYIPSTVKNISQTAFGNASIKHLEISRKNPVYYIQGNFVIARDELFDEVRKVIVGFQKDGFHFGGKIPYSMLLTSDFAQEKTTFLNLCNNKIEVEFDVDLKESHSIPHCVKDAYKIVDGFIFMRYRNFDEDFKNILIETQYCDDANVVLPRQIGCIASGAFRNLPELCSVTIPNINVVIEKDAFLDCPNLTKVILDNSMLSEGESPNDKWDDEVEDEPYDDWDDDSDFEQGNDWDDESDERVDEDF